MRVKLFSALLDELSEFVNAIDPTVVEFVPSAVEKAVSIKFCNKCAGRGVIPCYHYVSGGVCFKCDGIGTLADAGVNFQNYKKSVLEQPQEFIASLVKLKEKQEKARIRAQKKAETEAAKLAQAKIEALAHLSESDRQIVEGFLNTETSDVFILSISSKFAAKGIISEKQITALLEKDAKMKQSAELKKGARKLVSGSRYADIVGKISKIERVEVQINSWTSSFTNKVVLLGEHEEVFIVKTDNAKLMEKFNAAKEVNAEVVIDAVCKWVAADKNINVFSSRGMRVALNV